MLASSHVVASLGIAIGCSALVVGCGSSDGDSNEADDTAVPATVTLAPLDAELVELFAGGTVSVAVPEDWLVLDEVEPADWTPQPSPDPVEFDGADTEVVLGMTRVGPDTNDVKVLRMIRPLVSTDPLTVAPTAASPADFPGFDLSDPVELDRDGFASARFELTADGEWGSIDLVDVDGELFVIRTLVRTEDPVALEAARTVRDSIRFVPEAMPDLTAG